MADAGRDVFHGQSEVVLVVALHCVQAWRALNAGAQSSQHPPAADALRRALPFGFAPSRSRHLCRVNSAERRLDFDCSMVDCGVRSPLARARRQKLLRLVAIGMGRR